MKKVLSFILGLSIICTQAVGMMTAHADEVEVYNVFNNGLAEGVVTEISGDTSKINTPTVAESGDDGTLCTFEFTGGNNSNHPLSFFKNGNGVWDMSGIKDTGYIKMRVRCSEKASGHLNIYLATEQTVSFEYNGETITKEKQNLSSAVTLASLITEDNINQWVDVKIPLSAFAATSDYWYNLGGGNGTTISRLDIDYTKVKRLGFRGHNAIKVEVQSFGVYNTVDTSFAITSCDVNGSDIDVNWRAYSGAAGYVVKSNGTEIGRTEADTLTFKHTAPTADVLNAYTVEAVNADGNVLGTTAAVKQYVPDSSDELVYDVSQDLINKTASANTSVSTPTNSGTIAYATDKDNTVTGTGVSHKITTTGGESAASTAVIGFEKLTYWDMKEARDNGGCIKFWIKSTETDKTAAIKLQLQAKNDNGAWVDQKKIINLQNDGYYTLGEDWTMVKIPLSELDDNGTWWNNSEQKSEIVPFNFSNVVRFRIETVTKAGQTSTVNIQNLGVYKPAEQAVFALENFNILKNAAATEVYYAGDTLQASVDAVNDTDEAHNFVIISALYDSTGKLLSIYPFEGCTSNASSGTQTFTLNVQIPSDAQNTTLKAFVFDNLSSIKPLADAQTAVQSAD